MLRVLVALVALALGFAAPGCGPDAGLIVAEMRILEARVEGVGSDFADLAWATTHYGDTRVDFAVLAADSTSDPELDSVSDELYLPRWQGGGVTVPDPGFESVSNTRYRDELVQYHRIRVDRLLPSRTYAATVSSANSLGGAVHEFGVRLLFTTLPADDG